MAADVNVLGLNIELQLSTGKFQDDLTKYFEAQTVELSNKFDEAFTKAAKAGMSSGVGKFIQSLSSDTAAAGVAIDGLLTSMSKIAESVNNNNVDTAAMAKAIDAISMAKQLKESTQLEAITQKLTTAVSEYNKVMQSASGTTLSEESIAQAEKLRDDVKEIRKAIDHKNIGHEIQNDLMERSNEIIGDMGDGIDRVADGNQKSTKYADLFHNAAGRILSSILAASKAADKFATVNYRMYGDQENMVRASYDTAMSYGIMEEAALEARAALGALTVTPDSIGELSGLVGQFSRVTGASIPEAAMLAKQLQVIGYTSQDTEKYMGDLAFEMRKFGLTAGEVVGPLNKIPAALRALKGINVDKQRSEVTRLAGTFKKFGLPTEEVTEFANKLASDMQFNAMISGIAGIDNAANDVATSMQAVGAEVDNTLKGLTDPTDIRAALEGLNKTFGMSEDALYGAQQAYKEAQDWIGKYETDHNMKFASMSDALKKYNEVINAKNKAEAEAFGGFKALFKEAGNLSYQYDQLKSSLNALGNFISSVFWPGLAVLVGILNAVLMAVVWLGHGIADLWRWFKGITQMTDWFEKELGTLASTILTVGLLFLMFGKLTWVVTLFKAIGAVLAWAGVGFSGLFSTASAGFTFSGMLRALARGIVSFIRIMSRYAAQLALVGVAMLAFSASIGIIAYSVNVLSKAGDGLTQAGIIIGAAMVGLTAGMYIMITALSAGGATAPLILAFSVALLVFGAAIVLIAGAAWIAAHAFVVFSTSLNTLAEIGGWQLAGIGLGLIVLAVGLAAVAVAGIIFAAALLVLTPAVFGFAAALFALSIPLLIISAALWVTAQAFSTISAALMPLVENAGALLMVGVAFVALGIGLMFVSAATAFFVIAAMFLIPTLYGLAGAMSALAAPLLIVSIGLLIVSAALMVASIAFSAISAALMPLIENAGAFALMAVSFVVFGAGLLIAAVGAVAFSLASILLIPALVGLSFAVGMLSAPLMLIAVAMVLIASSMTELATSTALFLESGFELVAVIGSLAFAMAALMIPMAIVTFAMGVMVIAAALLVVPLTAVAFASIMLATAFTMVSDSIISLLDRAGEVATLAAAFVVLAIGLGLSALAGLAFSVVCIFLVPAIILLSGALIVLSGALMVLSVPLMTIAFTMVVIAAAVWSLATALYAVAAIAAPLVFAAIAVGILAVALGFLALVSIPATIALGILSFSLAAFGAAMWLVQGNILTVGLGIMMLGIGMAAVARSAGAVATMREFANAVNAMKSALGSTGELQTSVDNMVEAVKRVGEVSDTLSAATPGIDQGVASLTALTSIDFDAIGQAAESLNALAGVDAIALDSTVAGVVDSLSAFADVTTDVERLSTALNGVAEAIDRLNAIGSLTFDVDSIVNATAQLGQAADSIEQFGAELDKAMIPTQVIAAQEEPLPSSPIASVQVKSNKRKVASEESVQTKILKELRRLNDTIEENLDPDKFKDAEIAGLLKKYLPEIAEKDDDFGSGFNTWTS